MKIYSIAIVNSEGNIEQMYYPSALFPDEGVWEHDNTKRLIHVTSEVPDFTYFMSIKWWNDGSWRERTAPEGPWNTWVNGAWTLNSEGLLAEIRQTRDGLLMSCDWTVLSDSSLSDSKKAEWVTYRQALRDVPSANANVTTFASVSWPTQPT